MSATSPAIIRGRLTAAAIACALAVGLAAPIGAQTPKKDDSTFQTTAPSAILIDSDSGTVLFERNADQLMPPSSLAKLMTAEYVFHALPRLRCGGDLHEGLAFQGV